MLTRKLHQAYLETDRLAKFLKARDWDSAGELVSIIDTADDEIERIVNRAIDDVRKKLERYAEEASVWSENRMTDLNGKLCKITKAEQRKAKIELKRINKTSLSLLELGPGQ